MIKFLFFVLFALASALSGLGLCFLAMQNLGDLNYKFFGAFLVGNPLLQICFALILVPMLKWIWVYSQVGGDSNQNCRTPFYLGIWSVAAYSFFFQAGLAFSYFKLF